MTKTPGCRIAPFLMIDARKVMENIYASMIFSMTLLTALVILGNATIFLRIIQQKNTGSWSVSLSTFCHAHKKVRQISHIRAFVRLFLHKNFMISPAFFQCFQPLVESCRHNTQDHNA